MLVCIITMKKLLGLCECSMIFNLAVWRSLVAFSMQPSVQILAWHKSNGH